MTTTEKTSITVEATINAPVEKVWNLWTEPKHIIHWNNASDDWHTPKAENDLRAGGTFLSRMEAKDGSMGFDFEGKYSTVEKHKRIAYTLGDGRQVQVSFLSKGKETTVTETFEAEQTNTIELQQSGWLSILTNFKKYVEELDKSTPLHFEISINAKVEKVYKTMLDEKQFALWTAVFNPASHLKGSWEKGSKILFLGTDEDGTIGGMVSRIKENIANRFVSIEHLGIIKNGEELMSGPEVETWANALENYTFTEVNGKTLLLVDMVGGNSEFDSYFMEVWPKALDKLKSLCEN